MALLCLVSPWHAGAQQTLTGFAVERLYPSPPGSGWFVMDDLTFGGKLDAAIQLIGGYAGRPLHIPASAGTQPFSLVSGASFVNLGVAVTWSRYRAYLDLPVPITVSGTSGTIGPYQVPAPSLTPGNNPDTIADPSLGFEVRVFGTPESSMRLGVGGQLIFPSGFRSDYDSDARYRAMFRLLAAGDSGSFTWAGQLGVHVRSLNDSLIPGGPDGSEFLFGASGGRKFSRGPQWRVVLGPEIFGETAFNSFFASQQTGLEGLMTGRFEQAAGPRRLRLKVGIGYGLVAHFGAPQWRVVAAVELVGQRQ